MSKKNDRAKAIKYRQQLEQNYGAEIFSKSRKRENVLVRRMLVTFLMKEKKFTGYFIAKIFNTSHQSVFHFMKPVIDLEFERFYKVNFKALMENFEKIENNVISS